MEMERKNDIIGAFCIFTLLQIVALKVKRTNLYHNLETRFFQSDQFFLNNIRK